MKRVLFQDFTYYENKITFKKGVNYVVGSNGSGKTVFYKFLMSALGLDYASTRRSRHTQLLLPTSLKLNLMIDDVEYCFERDSSSDLIRVKKVGQSNYIELKVYSNEYSNYLHQLFSIKLNVDSDNSQVKNILRLFFVGDIVRKKRRAFFEDELMPILGYNIDLIKKSKASIDQFKEELSTEELINKELKKFKNKLIQKMRSSSLEESNINIVTELISSEFSNNYNTLIQKSELLNDTKSAFNNMKSHVDRSYNQQLSEIESRIADICLKNMLTPISVLDFKSDNMSYGEFSLYYMVFMLVLSSEKNIRNAPGILICDGMFSSLDMNQIEKVNIIIQEICEANSLQAILISDGTIVRNQDLVVFNLDKVGHIDV
jgi:energy-coupling factor transporter ATP-binding protein EcfA2